MWKFGNYKPCFPNGPLIGIDGSKLSFAGGDVGWLSPLEGTNHHIATFGDSYWDKSGSFVRRDDGTGIVGNVVGISTCDAGKFSIEYYHGGTADKAMAFFTDDYDTTYNTRMSCLKSFMYNKKLYFTMYRKKQDTGHAVGTMMARIDNPYDKPTAWNKKMFFLTTAGQSVGIPDFGNELFRVGEYLVIYGTYNRKVLAISVPLKNIETTPNGGNLFSEGVEYLSEDGSWKQGYQGPDFLDIKIPTTAGFSSRYNSGTKMWQVVFTNTTVGGGFPPYASIMVGPGPFGPWETERILGYFPEMTPTHKYYNSDKIVYGVVENTDFSPDPFNKVAVIYTVASRKAFFTGDFSYQSQNPNVYRVVSGLFDNPYLKG